MNIPIVIAILIFLVSPSMEVGGVGAISAETAGASATSIYGAPASISKLDIKIVKGDVASGVVLERRDGQIAIDITPCKLNDKEVKVFRPPFTEKKISDVKCGNQSYPRVQVIQEGGI